MSRPELTVLTTPILGTPTWAYRRARRALRPLVKPGVPLPEASPYPGHYAVTRSVVEGLRNIGADFNFNPESLGDLGRIVYAPANEALRQAAALKQQGRIDYLVAGPVNALFSDECDGILRMPEIDRVIVACDWALGFYDDAPELKRKSVVCPCGVDAAFWAPSGSAKDAVVVYWKSGTADLCAHVEAAIVRRGLTPIRIASAHGQHRGFTSAEFRARLDRAVAAVFLSSFETQGIALAEAWSMDVPTVVWDPRDVAEWRGRTFLSGSSCPYLTQATGVAWRTPDEFELALSDTLTSGDRFQPRAWVLANMTDAVCARALHRLILDGAHSTAAVR